MMDQKRYGFWDLNPKLADQHFVLLIDLTDQQIPWNAPHPILHCTCGEGRVLTEYTKGDHKVIRHWLPGVHDCVYIKERNKRLGIV